MPQPPLGLVARLSKKRYTPTAGGASAGGHAPGAPKKSPRSHDAIPEIVVERAAIQPPSSRVAVGFDGRVSPEILIVQSEFAKAEQRDTYETASAAIGRLLKDHGGDEDIVLECFEQMKLAATPWGLRFCGWVLQVLAEECAPMCALHLSVLASQSLPVLLSAAKREDDLVYVLESVGKVVRSVEGCYLSPSAWAPQALYPRFFYYLLGPLLPVVAAHGVAQLWSSEAVATILQNSENLLLGSPTSLTGPCNGEMDEVLHPVFDTVMSLVLGLKGKVHPAAQCAVLCLADTVLDVALMLCTYHAPLYSMEELLKVPQRKLLATCVEYTHFREPWKLRLGACSLLRTLTKGGLGSKWRFKDVPYAAVLSGKVTELSKTDKVKEVRELAKVVLRDLDPVGRFAGMGEAPEGRAAVGRRSSIGQQDKPSPSTQHALSHRLGRYDDYRVPGFAEEEQESDARSALCPKCGHPPQHDSDRFCPYCGAPRDSGGAGSPVLSPQAPPSPTSEAALESADAIGQDEVMNNNDATPPSPTPFGAHPAVQAPIERLLGIMADASQLADPTVAARVPALISDVNRAQDLERLVLAIARRVGWQPTEARPHLLTALFQALAARSDASPEPLALTAAQNQCLLQVLMTAQGMPEFRREAAAAMGRLDFSVSM